MFTSRPLPEIFILFLIAVSMIAYGSVLTTKG